MGLQVWLPFTDGSLKQQGSSNLIPSGTAFTSSANGKLGRCIKTTNGGSLDLKYNGNQVNTGSISFGGWFNFNKEELQTTFSSYNYTDVRTTPTGNLIGNSSYNGVGLVWYTNNMYTSNKVLNNLYIISTLRSNTNGARATSSYEIPFDTWVHLFLVFNKETKVLQLWINGALIRQSTMLDFSDARNYNLFLNYSGIWGGNGPGFNIPFLTNDVRIYDEALSEKEIKRISQGLILHYLLNRNGWGLENLMPNSINMPLGSSSYTTGTWRNAGTSRMTRSRVAITDSPIGNNAYGFQSVGLQTHYDASCWGIDAFPRESGATYTLSAWGRIVGGSSTPALLGFTANSSTYVDYGGSYGKAKGTDEEYYGDGAYAYAGGRLNPNGEWTKVWRTFTSTSTAGAIYVGFCTAQTGDSVTVQVCGVKLEKNNVMTPWIPHNNEDAYTLFGLNSMIEYDYSGYCNNGQYYTYDTNGSITYTSDTPKYAISTHIESANPTSSAASGTRYLYGHCSLTNPTQMSVAFWLKPISGGYGNNTGQGYFCTTNYAYGSTSVGTDYQSSAMNHRDSTIDINDSSSNTQCRPSFSPTMGEWHHYVITYDGQVGRVYKDGTQTSTAQFNAVKTLDSFIGVVIGFSKAGGVWRRNNACYSDFRLYATTLSSDDIKSLYQNCVTIDSDGIIRGQLRS